MTKIAITGSASFVGIHLIRELLKQKDVEIYALVRPNSKSNVLLDEFKDKIKTIEIDMSNMSELSKKISYLDIIYLLAWRGTRGADRNDVVMQKANYDDSMSAALVALRLGAKTIIGVGSQAEYGITYDNVTEEHSKEPTTEYGKNKLQLFNKLSELSITMKFRFIWGRIFSAYGVGDYSNSLVMYSLANMLKNAAVELSPCTQMWNFINIKDVAKIFALFSTRSIPSGAYNLASNDTRILKDYVAEMAEITHTKSTLLFGAVQNNIRLMNLLPDNHKLLSAIPDLTFVSFKDGIQEIIAFLVSKETK